MLSTSRVHLLSSILYTNEPPSTPSFRKTPVGRVLRRSPFVARLVFISRSPNFCILSSGWTKIRSLYEELFVCEIFFQLWFSFHSARKGCFSFSLLVDRFSANRCRIIKGIKLCMILKKACGTKENFYRELLLCFVWFFRGTASQKELVVSICFELTCHESQIIERIIENFYHTNCSSIIS